VSRTVSSRAVAAIAELARRLETLRGGGLSLVPAADRVRRLEVEIERSDPLLWLGSQTAPSKIYWRDRDGQLEIAAIGAADIMRTDRTDQIAELVATATGVARESGDRIRYFVGSRFDPDRLSGSQDPRWGEFGAIRLVLPRFELVFDGHNHILACNVLDRELASRTINDIIAAAQELRFQRQPIKPPSLGLSRRHDAPDRGNWTRQVNRALGSFRAGRGQKLVLARRTSLDCRAAVNPWHLLRRLSNSGDSCFAFGIQPNDAAAFVGASPERLYRRDHDRILTEAVAGTRPRGTDRQSDGLLARELASSAKERQEHDLVVDGISSGLDRLCVDHAVLESSAPLRLSGVQHLVTRFAGRLKPGINDFDILATLHPSPAVGGFPPQQAPEQLREYEPFDRGWYAGAVGWIGADSAEFAVAIRAALISGRRVELFSGAGIVAASRPDDEWSEIESKISPFLNLFSGES